VLGKILQSTSVALLALVGFLAATASGAGAAACGANQRQLNVKNSASQDTWVGGGGGALRSVCVVSTSESCLPAASTINAGTGACQCGTDSGTLACPATSQPIGTKTNGGLNCQCATDADCGPTAGCNTNVGVCYFVLPQAKSPASFDWKLPRGRTAQFCLDPASVTWNSQTIPSAVWWSGGIFARTGCKSDGTGCTNGDCGAQPNSNCPAGVGGNNPVTLAEFTLQRQDNDFYDISVINGANLAETMAPMPAPTATPGTVSKQYWCKQPGNRSSPFRGLGCNWNFGKYVKEVPFPSLSSTTDYTPLLLDSSATCDTAANPTGCPTGYTCSGSPGACIKTCSTDNDCTGTGQSHCVSGGNGTNYCQCQAEKDCAGNGYCGIQFIPGVGPNQTFLQECGKFAGWWSVDDLCANQNNIVGPFDCGASVTDGDSTSSTNLASLFGCVVRGGSSPGNGTSCYNQGTAATYPETCCGCATEDQSDTSLGQFWPKNGTGACFGNDTTWASQVQPFLVNLKQACPTAYSYPYDDVTSTFQCRSKKTINTLGYAVTFGNLVKPAAPKK